MRLRLLVAGLALLSSAGACGANAGNPTPTSPAPPPPPAITAKLVPPRTPKLLSQAQMDAALVRPVDAGPRWVQDIESESWAIQGVTPSPSTAPQVGDPLACNTDYDAGPGALRSSHRHLASMLDRQEIKVRVQQFATDRDAAENFVLNRAAMDACIGPHGFGGGSVAAEQWDMPMLGDDGSSHLVTFVSPTGARRQELYLYTRLGSLTILTRGGVLDGGAAIPAQESLAVAQEQVRSLQAALELVPAW